MKELAKKIVKEHSARDEFTKVVIALVLISVSITVFILLASGGVLHKSNLINPDRSLGQEITGQFFGNIDIFFDDYAFEYEFDEKVNDNLVTGMAAAPNNCAKYYEQISENADALDIDSDFYKKVFFGESNCDPTAKNPFSSASGIGQITDATYATIKDKCKKSSKVLSDSVCGKLPDKYVDADISLQIDIHAALLEIRANEYDYIDLSTREGVINAILAPAINNPALYVAPTDGSECETTNSYNAYCANMALDLNKDGKLTLTEATAWYSGFENVESYNRVYGTNPNTTPPITIPKDFADYNYYYNEGESPLYDFKFKRSEDGFIVGMLTYNGKRDPPYSEDYTVGVIKTDDGYVEYSFKSKRFTFITKKEDGTLQEENSNEIGINSGAIAINVNGKPGLVVNNKLYVGENNVLKNVGTVADVPQSEYKTVKDEKGTILQVLKKGDVELGNTGEYYDSATGEYFKEMPTSTMTVVKTETFPGLNGIAIMGTGEEGDVAENKISKLLREERNVAGKAVSVIYNLDTSVNPDADAWKNTEIGTVNGQLFTSSKGNTLYVRDLVNQKTAIDLGRTYRESERALLVGDANSVIKNLKDGGFKADNDNPTKWSYTDTDTGIRTTIDISSGNRQISHCIVQNDKSCSPIYQDEGWLHVNLEGVGGIFGGSARPILSQISKYENNGKEKTDAKQLAECTELLKKYKEAECVKMSYGYAVVSSEELSEEQIEGIINNQKKAQDTFTTEERNVINNLNNLRRSNHYVFGKLKQVMYGYLDGYLDALSWGIPSAICDADYFVDSDPKDISLGAFDLTIDGTGYKNKIEKEIRENIDTIMVSGERSIISPEELYRYSVTLKIISTNGAKWKLYLQNGEDKSNSVDSWHEYGTLPSNGVHVAEYAGSSDQDMIFECDIENCDFNQACLELNSNVRCYNLVEQ